jgi:streptomycin 6-kinase
VIAKAPNLSPEFIQTIQTIQNSFGEDGKRWLAIDPKGVIGPRGYEVGPFLFNPIDRLLSEGNPRVRTERRIVILSDLLAMERERIRA